MPELSERHFDASQMHGLDKVETSGRKFMGDWNVRFGSKADIRTAKGHVRFTPES